MVRLFNAQNGQGFGRLVGGKFQHAETIPLMSVLPLTLLLSIICPMLMFPHNVQHYDYMLVSNPNDNIAFNVLNMHINLSDHHLIMAVCACSSILAVGQNADQTNQAEINYFRRDHDHMNKYSQHTQQTAVAATRV